QRVQILLFILDLLAVECGVDATGYIARITILLPVRTFSLGDGLLIGVSIFFKDILVLVEDHVEPAIGVVLIVDDLAAGVAGAGLAYEWVIGEGAHLCGGRVEPELVDLSRAADG